MKLQQRRLSQSRQLRQQEQSSREERAGGGDRLPAPRTWKVSFIWRLQCPRGSTVQIYDIDDNEFIFFVDGVFAWKMAGIIWNWIV